MSLEERIEKKVPLAKLTSFKIGGPADLFFQVENEKDLIEIFEYIKKNKLKYFILGGGSNIIFSDEGFRGIVIKIANSKIDFKENRLTIGAGKKINEVIGKLKEKSLSGLEWAYGIPATVGGLIVNNGGAFGHEIGNNVRKIKAYTIKNNKIIHLKNKECNFSYRDSLFKKNKDLVVWEIDFDLEKKDEKEIEKLMNQNIKYRKEKQPIEYPSAGSFFKNIKLNNLEGEERKRIIEIVQRNLSKADFDFINSIDAIPIGLLIDKLGLKGKKIGGAEVSTKHGNFLINTGKAKAEDVIILASIIKQKIRQKLGIQLYEEIEYIGF